MNLLVYAIGRALALGYSSSWIFQIFQVGFSKEGQNSHIEKCPILLITLLYNPLNNFCWLSLDKTDQVIQNRTMVIRRYPPSDLIPDFISTAGEGQETSKRSSLTFNRSWKTKEYFLQKPVTEKLKLVDNSAQRNTKNPQHL